MKGVADGEEAARRWRNLVAGTRGVFVLRDSIWSQQDHPYLKRPHALMMPPSWVTAAKDDVATGHAIRAPMAPPMNDDVAWAAIKTPEALFGSFPSSDSMHREVIIALGPDSEQARRTRAARESMHSLAADVRAMIAAAPKGRAAVAEAGAERIAMSDEKYFGAALRYHRVIPIFVENPNTKELTLEGKGMVPLGRNKPTDELVHQARDAVYRRRLRAGDLAVERYDLSVSAERKRATALLEALIPADTAEAGGTLWLWVTGRLDPHRKAQGENATKYLPLFRKQLATAKIDHARLRLVSKPAADIPTDATRSSMFDRDVRWFRRRDLPYAVRISAYDLRNLLFTL
jgi:hypothetical protein